MANLVGLRPVKECQSATPPTVREGFLQRALCRSVRALGDSR